MRKKSLKIHKRAVKVGSYLTKDSKRKDGGLLYTMGAVRTKEFEMGKLGPASGVRRIDPETGEVIEVISQAAIAKAKAANTQKRGRGPKHGKRK